MTSNRPYLLRALYEWISDNQLTPYVLVSATEPNVQVPQAYIKDGKIVLSVAMQAVRDLVIDNEAVQFSARFSGIAHSIYAPMESVMAIYAKENGQGMFFQPGNGPDNTPPDSPDSGPSATQASEKPARPSLKVVK